MSASSSQNPFSTNIGQKFIVAITGIFLITFLIVHVSINTLLLVGEEAFMPVAHFMGTNPVIRIMEVVLMAGLLGHIVTTLWLTNKSRGARKVSYKKTNHSKSSSFYSRYMAVSGSLLLFFLILHFADFWFGERFLSLDSNLYERVQMKLAAPWRVGVYVVGMVVLMLHLLHGFQSAFQTLGIRVNTNTGKVISGIGVVFAIAVSALFASMPIYFLILGQ